MRKKCITIFSIISIMLFTFVVNSPISYAETQHNDMTIETQLTGVIKPEVDPTFTIIIQRDHENFPMPLGSEDGIYTLEMIGSEEVLFPEIEFEKIGDYVYTISQVIDHENDSYKYDETIYKLFIIVTLNEETKDLEVTYNLFKLGEEDKSEKILFVNEYVQDVLGEKVPKPEEPKKPDEGVLGEKVPLPLTGSVDIYYMLGIASVMIGLLIKTLGKTKEES